MTMFTPAYFDTQVFNPTHCMPKKPHVVYQMLESHLSSVSRTQLMTCVGRRTYMLGQMLAVKHAAIPCWMSLPMTVRRLGG